eukprot:NODE_4411_length_812_cov_25.524246_g4078_i0.p1 GENE.NODE_4411_length_812_cov_25.524246_g4078_i0~~NODE_4411_length_812_cov_25.524246_g4078_i0.p1  ORF type:complete len:192 (-),score=44.79 NODE_4411_length_812_cov_25.524246_g4078_i0:235-750(-)
MSMLRVVLLLVLLPAVAVEAIFCAKDETGVKVSKVMNWQCTVQGGDYFHYNATMWYSVQSTNNDKYKVFFGASPFGGCPQQDCSSTYNLYCYPLQGNKLETRYFYTNTYGNKCAYFGLQCENLIESCKFVLSLHWDVPHADKTTSEPHDAAAALPAPVKIEVPAQGTYVAK